MQRASFPVIAALLLFCFAARVSAQDMNGLDADYLDDRSAPEEVVQSYFNAIGRHEYARAYSYWEPGAVETQLGPFDEFADGYADTAAVDIQIGEVQHDVGAGQLYGSVPVGIWATATDGTVTTYVGCYRTHLGRPQLQAVPPFHPMGIMSATVRALGDGEELDGALAEACAR